MSKELTEQLENGTLKEGLYWCEITESPYVEQVHLPCYDDIVVEVLAPVPTYEQFVNVSKKVKESDQDINALKERLKEAEEVIEFYANSKIGELQKDGTYMVSMNNNFGNVNIIYDPTPAKRYLKKYKTERIKNG